MTPEASEPQAMTPEASESQNEVRVQMTQVSLGADRSSVAARPNSQAPHVALSLWLWTLAAMVFAMVIVGGATRLTESGLSITEWKPISGVIPPLTQQAWLDEFEKFKQIPQYIAIFSDMDLSGFKVIFFWEFSHRLLGRLIGLVFVVPFLIFWVKRMIPQGWTPKLIGVLALGGFQGFVGWWMVKSGLVGRIEVAQERLAIHLLLASITFAFLVYLATSLRARPVATAEPAPGYGLRQLANGLIGLTLVQIFLGGLVAGLRAGKAFNTWPLMDGQVVPPGLFTLEPLWRNFLDNLILVQFQHRIVAYALFALALVQVACTYLGAPKSRLARRTLHVAGIVLIQAALGITTLVLVVPLWAALLHQAFAMLVLAAAVRHRAGMAVQQRDFVVGR
jgi:heme a synthase